VGHRRRRERSIIIAIVDDIDRAGPWLIAQVWRGFLLRAPRQIPQHALRGFSASIWKARCIAKKTRAIHERVMTAML
jgi:hypothetical protein